MAPDERLAVIEREEVTGGWRLFLWLVFVLESRVTAMFHTVFIVFFD